MRLKAWQYAFALVGLMVFLSSPAWATEHTETPAASSAGSTHQGKVVKAGDGKLTMTTMDGKNEHSHDVASDAVITCAGETCTLDDLDAGATITVTTEKKEGKTVVTKIEKESEEEDGSN